jgi:hypothetical protein
MVHQSNFLGHMPKVSKVDKRNNCPVLFTMTFFTINKIWNQINCPLMNEWRKCINLSIFLPFSEVELSFEIIVFSLIRLS